MKDPDIVAVRQLSPAMAEATDDSVGRTWRKMANAQRERAPRPVVRRWLVPVAAAAAVGALAVGSALWLSGGTGTGFQPGESGSIDTKHQNGGTGTRLPSAGPIDTNQALAQLAAASAQAGPAQVPTADQVVHVRIEGRFDASGGGKMEQQIREIWLDPQGLIAVQITDGSTSMMDGPKGDKEGNIAQGRAALAAEGPNFYHATPEWLASLPTDPAALYTLLQQTVQTNKWSQAHNMWNMMWSYYTTGDLLLSPANRAALFGVYANLGLHAEVVVIGGDTFIGLRHDENGSGDEVLFDPNTGEAVGQRSFYTDDPQANPVPRSSGTPLPTGETSTGQPKMDAVVTYQTFFEQELVAKTLIP